MPMYGSGALRRLQDGLRIPVNIAPVTIDMLVTRSGDVYTFTARRTANLSTAETRSIGVAGSTAHPPAATVADFGGGFPVATASFAAGAATAQFQVTSLVAQPE